MMQNSLKHSISLRTVGGRHLKWFWPFGVAHPTITKYVLLYKVPRSQCVLFSMVQQATTRDLKQVGLIEQTDLQCMISPRTQFQHLFSATKQTCLLWLFYSYLATLSAILVTLVHVVLCHNDSSTLRNAISFYSQLTVVIVKGFSALGTSIRIALLGIHDNLRKPWVSGSSFS